MNAVRAIAALIALIALAVIAGETAPAQAAPAAATRTIIITEERINGRYWVTNPRRRAVVERSVDLQPGQVVITDIVERPRREPVTVAVTLVPALADGRVSWSVSAATLDGQPAPAELQEQINARIQSAWANYARKQLGKGRVTALSITADAITITVEAGP